MPARVMSVRDPDSWYRFVTSSEYATYPLLSGDIRLVVATNGELYLTSFRIRHLGGLRVCESFGRESDGGIAPLTSFSDEGVLDAVGCVIGSLKGRCHLLSMTLKLWDPHYRGVSRALRRYGARSFRMYPRILELKESFEVFWRSMSKKARNRYRLFVKSGGRVYTADPLEFIKEVLEVNLSSPIRQGRLLPRSYRDPELVVKTALWWGRLVKRGVASFYVAELNGKTVGYAFIPHINGVAYAARFLVHVGYLRYGVGNGLLVELVRDLMENRKARVLKYGYWRNVNPGINHFLEQHGFKAWVEEVFIVPLLRATKPMPALSCIWGRLTNVVPRLEPALLAYSLTRA